jgi:hypothetical protein
MTDRAVPATSSPADPLHLLTSLIIALTREAELHTRQLSRFDDLIAARFAGIEAECQARALDLRGDLMGELGAELHRTRPAKRYTWVFAVLMIVASAILSYLVVGMAQEMNRMADYMYNMGHSLNDERPIGSDERKTAGASYVLAMADHMRAMREDIGAMRLAITHLDGSIAGMAMTMKTMSGNLEAMSKGMTTMNATIGQLRQDTSMMRASVGGMSNYTRAMDAPLGFMNAFLPW